MELIMSYAYYSSGERDEETNEYVRPKKWDSKVSGNILLDSESEQNQTETAISLPKEFDSSYYLEKQKKAKFDADIWDWIRYRKYAQAVYEMYKNITYNFYKKYAEDIEDLDFPAFINKDSNVNLDELAKRLDNAETELSSQFYRNNRTVQAKINRHKTLENLQDYAVKTWIMYHILNHSMDIPLKNSIRFKKVYESLDESDAINLIRIYRGCKILQRNYRIYVRSNFMEKQGHYLYKDVDIKEKYDSLVASLNGITSKECEDILQDIRPKIADIKENNQDLKNLIMFYHKYDDIQRTVWEIKRIGQEWEQNKGWYVFFDSSYDDGKDVYIRGENYKRFCEQVAKECKSLDEIFQADIKKIITELDEALQYSKQAHDISHAD